MGRNEQKANRELKMQKVQVTNPSKHTQHHINNAMGGKLSNIS